MQKEQLAFGFIKSDVVQDSCSLIQSFGWEREDGNENLVQLKALGMDGVIMWSLGRMCYLKSSTWTHTHTAKVIDSFVLGPKRNWKKIVLSIWHFFLAASKLMYREPFSKEAKGDTASHFPLKFRAYSSACKQFWGKLLWINSNSR